MMKPGSGKMDAENQKIMSAAFSRLQGGAPQGDDAGHEQDEDALLQELEQAMQQAQSAVDKLKSLQAGKSGNPDLRENPNGVSAENGGSQPMVEGAS